MKNEQELRALANTCSQALESKVLVEQDETGSLTFAWTASKNGARIQAVPWGETHDKQELWKFIIEEVDVAPIGTLEPLMICGLFYF